MDLVNVLNRLVKAEGVTGFEHCGINGVVKELFEQYTEGFDNARVYSDVNGNVFAEVGDSGPTLLIMAHMDEIGMCVTGIEKNGMLRMASVAGVDPRVLPGSRVLVLGAERLAGVVGAIPPHLTASKDAAYKWDELFVDLGYPYEKVCELVSVGDRITFYPEDVLELKNGFISSKTLDDRALIAAELYCLEILKKRRFNCKVVMCASVNEEKTGLGSRTASLSVKPDMGIVMDVTFGKAACTPDEADMDEMLLAVGPNIHPKMFAKLKEAADGAKLKWDYEPCMGATGTDATDMQVAGMGVPCVLISPPLRYMHTNVETISGETLLNCGRLCAEFITALDENWREMLCLD
ncbi:MAG: M20/M25/M40 family metallo-hydrolase [Clostridia bacterium]|nr:M20/M25/M40 family metallo-hydrolase [Clostridia bacterium]